MSRKVIDYDEKDSGNTETRIATDNYMKKEDAHYQLALEEGFASSDGVRGITAATGGRVKHPERSDEPSPSRIPETILDENPGLADD